MKKQTATECVHYQVPKPPAGSAPKSVNDFATEVGAMLARRLFTKVDPVSESSEMKPASTELTEN